MLNYVCVVGCIAIYPKVQWFVFSLDKRLISLERDISETKKIKIMLEKCSLATSLFLFFLCFALAVYNNYVIYIFFGGGDFGDLNPKRPKLILPSCSYDLNRTLLGPSLESFIQALITDRTKVESFIFPDWQ